MSQAQEERRERSWESIYKPQFEESAARLREEQEAINLLPEGSEERQARQLDLDGRKEELIEWAMKMSP